MRLYRLLNVHLHALTSGSTQCPGWQSWWEARGLPALSCGTENLPTGSPLERARTASPEMTSEEFLIANSTRRRRMGYNYNLHSCFCCEIIMYTRPMRYFFSASQSTLASVNFSAVALLCARRNRDCNWRVFSHFSQHHGDLVVLAQAEDRAAWAAGGSATSTVM